MPSSKTKAFLANENSNGLIICLMTNCKESWPKGLGFGLSQRGFALLEIH